MILLTLNSHAFAQRPRCDYGQGVNALRKAQERLALPIPGLVAGRELARSIAGELDTARAAFERCGCPRLAEMLVEPSLMAESAVSHPSVGRIVTTFEHTAFQAGVARQALDRDGCR